MSVSEHDADLNPLDRLYHAWLGRMTLNLSPAALILSYLDWLVHLGVSPGKQLQLVDKAIRKTQRGLAYSLRSGMDPQAPACIEPLPQDRRFSGEEWRQWPYNLIAQSFLNTQQWWYNATTGISGVSRQHEAAAEFGARQVLDTFSPTNFIATNPRLLQATLAQGGANLYRGWRNFLEDTQRRIEGKSPVGTEQFRVGEEVAVSPGKVVFRNRLIELIQYQPTGKRVYKQPLLIVPAWIMKYYILDLSPHNSLVKYLVEQGHTVFMISWKNPGREDRDLGLDDYRRLGVMAALDAISRIIPDTLIHALGYCLGGTLLSIATATMARDGDARLASATLLATQTDFTEVGELGLFINASQIAWLEDIMWEQGYLDTTQMAGAFSLIRSNDLIWSAMSREYLLGERAPMIDLMAWNADGTRLPYRMHSEYLERLYLNNDLAEGRYRVDDKTISLLDLRLPLFVVGTLRDHVAPWRSVFKIHRLAENSEVTFLLTSGGHNAGIISEPGHHHRHYQMAARQADAPHVDADDWQQCTPTQEGSWWPAWESWLAGRSGGKVAAPAMGCPEQDLPPLDDAPGRYVRMP